MRARILISGVTSCLTLGATYGIYITTAFPMGVPMFRYRTPGQIAANACTESFFVIWTLMVTVGRFLSSSEKENSFFQIMHYITMTNLVFRGGSGLY